MNSKNGNGRHRSTDELKVTDYTDKGSEERRVLIGMIADDGIIARIAAKHDPKQPLFLDGDSNLIAGWCIKYHRKYGRAIGKDLRSQYDRWAEDKKEDRAESIANLLASLSSEAANAAINPDYVLDQASDVIALNRLRRHVEEVSICVDNRDRIKGEELALAYGKVDLAGSTGVDLFQDEQEFRATFKKTNRRILVRYEGALEEYFGLAFRRDSFVVFMGMEKVGKSWWLLDVAFRAVEQGRRVAFFQVGDLSEQQIKERLVSRVMKQPWNSNQLNGMWPCSVLWPTRLITTTENGGGAERINKSLRFSAPPDADTGWKLCEEIMKTKDGRPLFRLQVHPNGTANVASIVSELKNWERIDGYRPDVIVIDYADVMAPEPGTSNQDHRHQINANWSALRTLSQVQHCLVVTASQADAESYDVKTLKRRNFSGDKRKHSHVSFMAGINQVPVERDMDVCRLNCLDDRNRKFDETKCVYVAGCRDLANPAVISSW